MSPWTKPTNPLLAARREPQVRSIKWWQILDTLNISLETTARPFGRGSDLVARVPVTSRGEANDKVAPTSTPVCFVRCRFRSARISPLFHLSKNECGSTAYGWQIRAAQALCVAALYFSHFSWLCCQRLRNTSDLQYPIITNRFGVWGCVVLTWNRCPIKKIADRFKLVACYEPCWKKEKWVCG